MTTWIKTKRKAIGLSQTEVADALGLSRPTYTKLENGLVKPSKEERAILAGVFGVSVTTLEKQEISPRISKKDISVQSIPKENVEKFKQTLLYILGKVGGRPNIGQTVLYKLLYFIDLDYYEKFEERLIGATYIKNTYGPTPVSFAKIVREMQDEGKLVEVKSKYFDKDQTKYVPVSEADMSLFSGNELKHIDDELERLAHKNARELSDLSHIDTPWLVAKEREVINYRHVFYRPEETSVGTYEPL